MFTLSFKDSRVVSIVRSTGYELNELVNAALRSLQRHDWYPQVIRIDRLHQLGLHHATLPQIEVALVDCQWS